MKGVRVLYTVHENYVEQNQANIKSVMEDLRANPIDGMYYSTYYLGEGRFMHLNVSKDESGPSSLNERASFIAFRTQLKASSPLSPPKSEAMEIVGSNKDVF